MFVRLIYFDAYYLNQMKNGQQAGSVLCCDTTLQLVQIICQGRTLIFMKSDDRGERVLFPDEQTAGAIYNQVLGAIKKGERLLTLDVRGLQI